MEGCYGPFTTRRQAREVLRELAARAGLCWVLLGLERRWGPCFARQVRKCAGACVGAEIPEQHHSRLRQALAPWALRAWPFPGLAGIRESSLLRDITEVHVLRDWCWLGTARDDAALQALIECPPRVEFDLDIYRLLRRYVERDRGRSVVNLQ